MPPLQVGQEVRVAPLQRHQSWKTGTCVEKLSDRSYLVKTSERTVRRNRHFLRTQEQPVSKPKVDPLTYSLTRDNLISTRPIQQCLQRPQRVTTVRDRFQKLSLRPRLRPAVKMFLHSKQSRGQEQELLRSQLNFRTLCIKQTEIVQSIELHCCRT